MTYLLDTDTCIYAIKRKPPEVLRHLRALTPGDVGLSSITVSELYYGAQRSQNVEKNLEALEQFLVPLVIVAYGLEASVVYGQVRAGLERVGTPIGPLDTLIAAHALQLGATLVTNNLRKFSRVPGLRSVSWA